VGLLTFATNVTLDGCVDHREGIADDETHDFFTRLMDESGAMLWGRVTYEMMESYWPAGPCVTRSVTVRSERDAQDTTGREPLIEPYLA
jgi:dihydrofolate reductase